MIIRYFLTTLPINYCPEIFSRIFRKFFYQMNNQVVFFLRIKNRGFHIFKLNVTGISDLSAGFTIKRRLIKYQLVKSLFLLSDLAVACNPDLGFQTIVAHKFCFFNFAKFYPIVGFLCGCIS